MRTRRLLLALLPILVACGGAAFSPGPDDAGPDSGPGFDGGGDGAMQGDSPHPTDATPDGAPVDGPTDAAPAADAGRFCTTAGASHAFCDDFDDRPLFDVQGAWDEVLTSGGGTINLDGASFTSPPHALFAQLPVSSTWGDPVAGLRKSFGSKVATIEFAVDVHVDAYGTNASGAAAAVAVVDVGPLLYTLVIDDPSHASFQESFQTAPDATGVPIVHAINEGLPVGVWGRIDCTLTYSQYMTPGHVTITYSVNGAVAKVLDEPLQGQAQAAPGTPTRLRIGAGAHQPTSAWAIRYDDVTVDTQ